ncbi:MAG TPA: nucleotidyltransferase family protein [Ktedonobacterales bacterium]|nr:nucleotidyltransferase family protein [Ktedonobacterales bacterium]
MSSGASPVSGGPVAVIILAAGRSTRMGEHKLLLPLGDKPLLAWGLAAACASRARPIILALGRSAAEVAAALPDGPYTTVVNEQFAEGMGTTLALAVAHLPANVIGTIVTLGDQPFMTSQAIDDVFAAAQAQPDQIIMGVFGGKRGHPVYLPGRLFGELLSPTGDEGARTVIARERGKLSLVTLEDERAFFDVDTAEDYQRAQVIAQSLGNRPA